MAAASPSSQPAHASARPFLLGCFLMLLALEVFGVIYTRNPHHWTDFRVYYGAGYVLRTHPSRLYDTDAQNQAQQIDLSRGQAMTLYLHPSYEALLYAPLTFLPPRPAYLVYMAFNTLLLVGVFFAGRLLFSAHIPWLQPQPGFMLLLFLPVAAVIAWGQNSILFLLLCTLAWRELERDHDAVAGLLLALALFKYQVAVPVALLTAARRSWRFSAGFIGTAAAIALLSIALVGRAAISALRQLVVLASLSRPPDVSTLHGGGVHPTGMPNLVGLLYVAGNRYLQPPAALAVVALASAGLMLWTFGRIRREPSLAVAFATAILCAILVSYHFFVYELALLVLPLALLADRVSYIVLLASYVLPAALFLTLGAHSFFLLAIPILGLLVYASSLPEKLRMQATTSPSVGL